jgi:hypothetical protein
MNRILCILAISAAFSSSVHAAEECFLDNDNDGFGQSGVSQAVPAAGDCPVGYAKQDQAGGDAVDCDDSDAAINPDATEGPGLAGNGVDEDCSGDDRALPQIDAVDVKAFKANHPGLCTTQLQRTFLACMDAANCTIDMVEHKFVVPAGKQVCDMTVTGLFWGVWDESQCQQTAGLLRRSGDGNGLSSTEQEAVQGMIDGLADIYLTQEGFDAYQEATDGRLETIETGVVELKEETGRNTGLLNRLFVGWVDGAGTEHEAIMPQLQGQVRTNADAIGMVQGDVAANAASIATNTTGVAEAKADRGYFGAGLYGAWLRQDGVESATGDDWVRGPASRSFGLLIEGGKAAGNTKFGAYGAFGMTSDQYKQDWERGFLITAGPEVLFGATDWLDIGPTAVIQYHYAGGDILMNRSGSLGGGAGVVLNAFLVGDDNWSLGATLRPVVFYETYGTQTALDLETDRNIDSGFGFNLMGGLTVTLGS